jgi:hypothetical protein
MPPNPVILIRRRTERDPTSNQWCSLREQRLSTHARSLAALRRLGMTRIELTSEFTEKLRELAIYDFETDALASQFLRVRNDFPIKPGIA